jgi:NADH-quinone oxidoreductase subunit J
MDINLITFLALAVVAVGSALAMLFARNAVISALFLILNFMTVALFYLILNAPFIAISQVTVYAGAIMVLFLFVIMLLGAEQTGRTPTRYLYQPAALVLAFIFLLEILFIVFTQRNQIAEVAEISSSFGAPLGIGKVLFNQYLLPFEATSILLLAAMIGAIVLTRGEKKE